MSKTILVAYATVTGSTAGIADVIGQILTEHGAQVEVRPIRDVTDLTAYQAVVVGSPIHDRQWLPEAMQFIRAHRSTLEQLPCATFTVCMTLAIKNQDFRAGVADWLQPVHDLIKPVSEGYFAGVLDIGRIPSIGDRVKFRFSVASGIWSEGDHRDWTAIRAWANDLARVLATEQA